MSGELIFDQLELKESECSNGDLNSSVCSETFVGHDNQVNDDYFESRAESQRSTRFDTLQQRSNVLPSVSPCPSTRSHGDSQLLADMSRAKRRRMWRSLDSDLLVPVDFLESNKKSTPTKSSQVKKSRIRKKRKALFRKKELIELLVPSGSTGYT